MTERCTVLKSFNDSTANYFMPTYHFMNWQDKNLVELTERWLRRMTNYVGKKIHSLENYYGKENQ